ncbi:MAG: GAF domain-containing protein [Anaerolineae bacterium]|nr:GAF domain-containing protein [Anaerolineae bacterium]
MESLKVSTGQTREKLTELQGLIRQQRIALLNGSSRQELATQMQNWEDMVQQVQADMVLEKSAQLSMLYEVSQSLNASLDWRLTLQAVMDAVIQITEAERGMLLVIDANNALQVEMTSSNAGEIFTENDMRFSYSVVEQTLQRGRPVLTTNAQIDPRFEGSSSVVAYGLRSILCAPLIHKGDPLGVVYLDNRARTGVFTQEDMTALGAFAVQAASALANAQEHKKTDMALTEKVRELTILQEMARDLNTTLNYERVMERSISWAIAAAGAGTGAMGLVAEEGIRWISQIGHLKLDYNTAMRCIYARKPIVEDTRLVLPLLRDERPIGVLYLQADDRGVRKHKLEFVMRVADNVAIAVENARLYEALRQANLAKSEFVTIVSHELRTPMTSILGYADILLKGTVGELSAQQTEFVGAMRRNIVRMRLLVSDLMDISRIETGRLKITPRPVSFKDALDEAVIVIQEPLAEKQQVLTVDVWNGLPMAHADPDRLTQILINLLSNAVKYTLQKGTIVVRVWLSPEEPNFIRCAVMDSGIGINPENQIHLFTKFFRADDPVVRDQPGTGLGLAITKNLVELHGGRIWVESAAGKGSTFFFTVPITILA